MWIAVRIGCAAGVRSAVAVGAPAPARFSGRATLATTLGPTAAPLLFVAPRPPRACAAGRSARGGATAGMATGARDGAAADAGEPDPEAMAAQAHCLAGSVKPFERHIVWLDFDLGAAQWPKKIETIEGVPKAYAQAVKDHDGRKLKFTAADASAAGPRERVLIDRLGLGPAEGHHSVLVFSETEAVGVAGIAEGEVESLVGAVGDPAAAAAGQGLAEVVGAAVDGARAAHVGGVHAFVCVHGSRDFRCGACGPATAAQLSEEALHCAGGAGSGHGSAGSSGAPRGAQGAGPDRGVEAYVWGSSHLGGHRHAPCYVLYPGGDWYATERRPEALRAVLELHGGAEAQALGRTAELARAKAATHAWRWGMGRTAEECKEIVASVCGPPVPAE